MSLSAIILEMPASSRKGLRERDLHALVELIAPMYGQPVLIISQAGSSSIFFLIKLLSLSLLAQDSDQRERAMSVSLHMAIERMW